MNDHTRWYYLARTAFLALLLTGALVAAVAVARASETVDPATEGFACSSEATLYEQQIVLDTCIHRDDEWFTVRVPAGHEVTRPYAIRYDPNVVHVFPGMIADETRDRVVFRTQVLDGVESVGSAPGQVDTGFGQIRFVVEFVPVDPAHTGGDA